MATQIIDNFQLNVAKPIDSRMVTNGTASRNSLAYIYEGLRVYDLVNKAPYVYIGGSWQQEGSAAAGGGSGGGGSSIPPGTTNKLLKYINSTTVGDSSIIDKSVGTTINVGIGMTPLSTVALDVNGNARATILKGNINGSYIDTGSIDYSKIAPSPTNDYVLKTISGSVQWVSSTELNTNIVINNQVSDTGLWPILFSSTSNSPTGTPIYANNYGGQRIIGVKPSTSQILGSGDSLTNTATNPSYAFSSNVNAGLYGNATEIGLSFNSTTLLKLNSTKLSIFDTSLNEVLGTGTGKVTFMAGEFSTTLNVTGLATVGSLSVGGTTTFAGGINTNTITTTGLATVASLSVLGTTTFASISTTTLTTTSQANFKNLTVTGTTTLETLSLGGKLDVTGQTTLTYLNVTGQAIFNGGINGNVIINSPLTVQGKITIGSYSIEAGVGSFNSINLVTGNTVTSNSASGMVYCQKLRIRPTTTSIPSKYYSAGYEPGDIIFVLDNNSTTDGNFFFNKGEVEGWVSLTNY